jgi:hypothetical protein
VKGPEFKIQNAEDRIVEVSQEREVRSMEYRLRSIEFQALTGGWRMVFAGKHVLLVMLTCLVLGAAGCNRDTGSAPKTTGELTEEQKLQIRQLNEQRAEEWGTPKRK